MRRIASASALAAAVLVASVMAATPASAHVIAETATAPSGSYSVITFSLLHGCEDSPTTSVTIELPEEIVAVTPTTQWNWTIEETVVPASVPGTSVTERTSEITFSAETPLPSGQRATFDLWLGMPQGEPGDVVIFPAHQMCEDGTIQDWVGDEAPQVTLTEAVAGGGHGHGGEVIPEQDADVTGGDATGGHETAHTEVAPTAADPLSRLLAAGALLLGVIAIIAAFTARRGPRRHQEHESTSSSDEPGTSGQD